MKTIIEFLKSRFLWVNILIAIVVVFVICFLILMFLKGYTRHGESVEVPVLVGYYENEAEQIVKENQLKIEIVDSVYLRDTQPGIIVEQTPRAGTTVKHDRIIFLTVNAMTKKIIPLPNLINVSERQATYTLSSLGFEVGNVEIVPSEFSDLVLDVKYKGYSVAAGEKLVDGASLTLVVGENGASYQGQMAFVPDLAELFLPDAQKVISEKNLVVGYMDFDVMPANEDDKKLYRVYRQNPERGESVIPGKRIDIYLSKDANKAQKIKGQRQKDDFF